MAGGNEDLSPASVVITVDTVAPAGLGNASPADLAGDQAVTTVVTATAATDGSGTVEYYFEVAQDSGFTVGVQQSGWQAGVSYAPTLTYNTQYFWHVKARDAEGNEAPAGVNITETAGATDVDEEGPGSDTYDVVLTSQPTGDVVVTVASQDTVTGVTADKSNLTFNNANWSTAQTVTVTAVDDSTVEVALHATVIIHDIDTGLTADGNYNALERMLDSVTANITENDNVLSSLTIIEPDGVTDTVTAGDPYLIEYNLDDPDDIIEVAFYYDTDGSGLNGTAILGNCATAFEGSGATCTWDTTGMTPGTYYIYGITTDVTGNDKTWTGGGDVDTRASTAANWSGNTIPRNGDNVIFDGTSTNDCNWDMNVLINSMSLISGYKGIVTINSFLTNYTDITINDGMFIQNETLKVGEVNSYINAYSYGQITIIN